VVRQVAALAGRLYIIYSYSAVGVAVVLFVVMTAAVVVIVKL
jgi:hypothetical protein